MSMRGMVSFQRSACIRSEVDVAVIVMAGGRMNAYLRGDEGDDGRRKDRDQSQTGQEISQPADGRHLGAAPARRVKRSPAARRRN